MRCSPFQIIDITDSIEKEVKRDSRTSGICVVSLMHTTAGLIVNEYEPNIAKDYIAVFKELAPRIEYAHNKIDNNAEAHVLSSIFGASKVFIIEDGKLVLGTWQRILLCEFDGPRKRRIIVRFLG